MSGKPEATVLPRTGDWYVNSVNVEFALPEAARCQEPRPHAPHRFEIGYRDIIGAYVCRGGHDMALSGERARARVTCAADGEPWKCSAIREWEAQVERRKAALGLGPEPQVDDGGKGGTTIAIDFDGVLHAYREGWKDGTIYDVAVPGAAEACAALVARGYELVVFTARDDLSGIRGWLDEHLPGIRFADVTNDKPIAAVYIDDRAIRFHDWTQAMSDVEAILPDPAPKNEAPEE